MKIIRAPITFKLTTEPVWNKGEEYGSGALREL